MANFAGIDKKNLVLALAVAVVAVPFVGEEPQAGGNLGIQEQFGRQVDDAVDDSSVDDALADGIFTGHLGG